MCFKTSFVSVAYVQVNLSSFLIVNCMKWVLSACNERLLTLNHLFKYSDTVIMPLTKFVRLECVTIILVSSANKIHLDLLVTKFIYL
jgi:predicted DNA-binding ribbon-helix-helix protein